MGKLIRPAQLRVICDFIPSNKPVRDQSEIGIRYLGVVGHLWRAPVRVFPMSKEVVDGIDRIALDGIIAGEELMTDLYGPVEVQLTQ